MEYIKTHLGFSTADANQVSLQYENGDLILSFVDWQEQCQSARFENAIAFRWQDPGLSAPREDETFEVVGSPWLEEQTRFQGVLSSEYAHYVLCFNACGTLDVVARRLP